MCLAEEGDDDMELETEEEGEEGAPSVSAGCTSPGGESACTFSPVLSSPGEADGGSGSGEAPGAPVDGADLEGPIMAKDS